MAESAVSYVLSSLCHQTKYETSVISEDTRAEIQLLRDEFLHLEYILKHVQEKQGPRYGMLNWESDVLKAAHGTEDLLEASFLSSVKFNQNNASLKSVIRFLSNLSAEARTAAPLDETIFSAVFIDRGSINHRARLQGMQRKIHDIVMTIKSYDLGDQYEILNYTSVLYNQHPPLRERLPRASREDVRGFDEKVQTLVNKLVNNDPCSLSSVSITGMGGVGKTTLAQCIYDDARVRDHFKVRRWVSISQKFTPKEVLLELLTELRANTRYRKDNLQRLQVPQLRSMLYEYLKQSRYLVVLDDVWTVQVWEFFVGLLPDTNSSRLILTTRNKQVAERTGGYTHPMPSELELHESWLLFKKKAFEIHKADPELMEIGVEINRKCEGLPLLVVGVGSFLSRKTWTREWQRVLSSMTPLGPRGKVDHLFHILLLSYKDLTPEVRSCFLCLGFFPRNKEIPTKKLFHMWISHGFVLDDEATTSGIQTMESKAESCLQEFIDKNLVQAKTVSANGKVKTCRLHPSIHELCILRAKEDICLEVQSETSSYDHPSISTRHKVILFNPDRQTHAPSLRSLLFYLPQGTSLDKTRVLVRYKLLRVLDLEGLDMKDEGLHRRLGRLMNLRYLNLRNTTGIKSLHSSMRKLHWLLMLDISGSEIVSGLSVIQMITSLQHVYLNQQRDRHSRDLRFDTLTQLRSIAWISQQELLTNELQELKLLRKLKLKMPSSSVEAWSKIAGLSQLETLRLEGEENEIIIPENIASSLNVKHLAMRKIKVKRELISIIAQLPHLMLLQLKESSIQGTAEDLELSMQNGNIRTQIFQCNHF